MSEALDIWFKPESKELYMIAGWRQWADAGSVSSGLPEYLLQKANARPVGTIHPGGFYLFQIPGTHNLLRPVVKFDEGFPESLQAQRNDLYFSGKRTTRSGIFPGRRTAPGYRALCRRLPGSCRNPGCQAYHRPGGCLWGSAL